MQITIPYASDFVLFNLFCKILNFMDSRRKNSGMTTEAGNTPIPSFPLQGSGTSREVNLIVRYEILFITAAKKPSVL